MPIINAVMAEMRTAAADTSLINFMEGWYSSETISANFSTAVLNNSAAHTKPVANTIVTASVLVTWKKIAAPRTTPVIMKWMMALCCSLKNEINPSKAYLKLFNRARIENGLVFIINSFFILIYLPLD